MIDAHANQVLLDGERDEPLRDGPRHLQFFRNLVLRIAGHVVEPGGARCEIELFSGLGHDVVGLNGASAYDVDLSPGSPYQAIWCAACRGHSSQSSRVVHAFKPRPLRARARTAASHAGTARDNPRAARAASHGAARSA